MNITFIGGGNMAGAIIGGLLNKGYAAGALRVVEIAPEARHRLEQQFGVQTYTAVSPDAVDSDCVVFAVKPQQVREAAIALKPLLSRQLVISIAAGIRATDLSRWLGGYQKLARAMPNTPALVGAGCTGVYALPGAGSEDKSRVDAILADVKDVTGRVTRPHARTNDATEKPGLDEDLIADDELDPNVLDAVHRAGARFSQIVTRLSRG